MADIARHCGVSLMTVSNVVRGIQCVKPSTAEKVRKALKEFGYQPDPLLSSLSKYRARNSKETKKNWTTLLFLNSDPSDYTCRIVEHLAEEAKAFGYHLQDCPLPDSVTEQRRLSRRLYHQGIRGAFLGPTQTEQHLDGFQAEHFTFISIGALRHSPRSDSVSQDYFGGLALAAEKCLGLGRRNIGFFVGRWHDSRTAHRWSGAYHTFCVGQGLTPRSWLYDGIRPPPREAFVEWLRKEEVDTVLTVAGAVANYRQATPDIQYVMLNDLDVPPGCWYLSVPLRVLAREGARLMDDHMRHHERGVPMWPRRISIQAQWRTGDDSEEL